MSTRVLNPELIREFARSLCGFTDQTRGQINELSARLQHLGEGDWRDETQRQYAREFGQAIGRIIEVINHFESVQNERLLLLAQQAEEIHY